MTKTKFIIGIDLGTTTCSLSYIETASHEAAPKSLAISQWNSYNTKVEDVILPSLIVLPVKSYWKNGQLNLNTDQTEPTPYAVGAIGLSLQTSTPTRIAHSAKSWLSQKGSVPHDKILPFNGDALDGNQRLSPIEVSANFLRHLKQCWDTKMAQDSEENLFIKQKIIITVPASFDEVASRHTLDAAVLAGYDISNCRLLEEPQAAFYSWYALAEKSTDPLQAGEKLLVCDIGGGTCDFSLFAVTSADIIERLAVSQHILLGGDNIDLSIAQAIEDKISPGKKLDPQLWQQLLFEAKSLKEKALALPATEANLASHLHLTLVKSGFSIFGNTISASISVQEIHTLIEEIFFPYCDKDQKSFSSKNAASPVGLAYAQDVAFTHHLAEFIAGQRVDRVLFAGGTMIPKRLQDRLLEQLKRWQEKPMKLLEGGNLQLSISLGASIFGYRKHFNLVLIEGGYPRSLYLKIAKSSPDEARQLLCILPQGYLGLNPLLINNLDLQVVIGQEVAFELCYATTRPKDTVGTILPEDTSGISHLAPMTTTLTGKQAKISVVLEIHLSPSGLLEVACVERDEKPNQEAQRWRLNFNVQENYLALSERLAEKEEKALVQLPPGFNQPIELLYGKAKAEQGKEKNPKQLINELERSLGSVREHWDVGLSRQIWRQIDIGQNARSRSENHELVWLNLAGYVLRPGYGHSQDKSALAQLWSSFDKGPYFPKSKAVMSQWWLLWRRISAGLTAEKQERLAEKLIPSLKNGLLDAEMIMALGSLERLKTESKVRIGNLVAEALQKKSPHQDRLLWTLARLSSRLPLYGGTGAVLRPYLISDWIKAVDSSVCKEGPVLNFFYTLAGRMIASRELDVDEETRSHILDRLVKNKAKPEQLLVVQKFVPPTIEDANQMFGEQLPQGIYLQ